MITRFYAALLRLYPRQFRAQFSDEMMTVFRQALEDHNRTGKVFIFLLRELLDLSLNLARAHWRSRVYKEFSMSIIKKPGWGFYPTWVLITTLSIPIAFILDLAILKVIIRFVGDFIYVNGVRHITEDYLSTYTFVPIVGLVTGILQYGLLCRYLLRMGWWMMATFGGWVLGLFLIIVSGWLKLWTYETFVMGWAFIALGYSIGVGQWLVLRKHLPRAGWWVGANVLGWSLLSLLTTGNSMGQFGLLGMGILPTCVTAGAFALLINQTQPTEP